MMPRGGRNAVPLHIPARYMVVSVISLIVWIGMTPWMLPKLMAAPLSFEVVSWVHLLTLGCIGSMILGSSMQLVPVALQNPFPATKIAEISWFLWIGGIVLFEIGFSRNQISILVPGAILLGLVLIGYAVAISVMFKRSPKRDTVAWHLLQAAWFSVLGFSLGGMLALSTTNGILGSNVLPVLAGHVVIMMVGWVGITILGVGYKLIGMFTLAERQIQQNRANISAILLVAGTLLAGLGSAFGINRLLISFGAGLILWGMLTACMEVWRMYDKRMRRTIDVHMPFAVAAFTTFLIGSVAFLALTFETQPLSNPLLIATAWFVFTGGILVAIQGFFYKISTFLIWLKTYSPLAGKVSVPPLDSMYNRTLAFTGLACWFASVLLVTAMLLGWLPELWGWSIGLWIGGTMFAVNVFRIGRHWLKPILPASPAVSKLHS